MLLLLLPFPLKDSGLLWDDLAMFALATANNKYLILNNMSEHAGTVLSDVTGHRKTAAECSRLCVKSKSIRLIKVGDLEVGNVGQRVQIFSKTRHTIRYSRELLYHVTTVKNCVSILKIFLKVDFKYTHHKNKRSYRRRWSNYLTRWFYNVLQTQLRDIMGSVPGQRSKMNLTTK